MWKFLCLAALVTFGWSMPLNMQPEWEDCGTDPERALFVTHFNVTPHPVTLPGNVTVNLHSENMYHIHNISLKLSIQRHIWMDYYVEIPCAKNYGSCDYKDLCSYLENPPKDAEEPMQKVKELFEEAGHSLKCPLEPKVFSVENIQHQLPELPPLVAMVATGKYKIRAEFYNPVTYRELGCFQLIVTAEEKKEEVVDEYDDDEYYNEDTDCYFFC